MNNQDRRTEVLKAEEAIRQLAGEMARASQTADGVDEIRRMLEEAAHGLTQARSALLDASEAIAARTEKSDIAFSEASQRIVKLTEAVEAAAAASRVVAETAAASASKTLTTALTESGTRMEQSGKRVDALFQNSTKRIEGLVTTVTDKARETLQGVIAEIEKLGTKLNDTVHASGDRASQSLVETAQRIVLIEGHMEKVDRLTRVAPTMKLALTFSAASLVGVLLIIVLVLARTG